MIRRFKKINSRDKPPAKKCRDKRSNRFDEVERHLSLAFDALMLAIESYREAKL